MCQLACHRNLDPVCASDGKTYANLCIMERESCLRKANLVVKYEGECSECFKLQTYSKSCFEIMRNNVLNDISLIPLALAVPMRNLETNRGISLENCTYHPSQWQFIRTPVNVEADIPSIVPFLYILKCNVSASRALERISN